MVQLDLDLQCVTLDFWLNRLLADKYGIRLSARIVYDKIYIYWFDGKNNIKVCEAPLSVKVELPCKKDIDKMINVIAKKRLFSEGGEKRDE